MKNPETIPPNPPPKPGTITSYDEATTLNEEIKFTARFLKHRPPPSRKLSLLDIERMHEMTEYDA